MSGEAIIVLGAERTLEASGASIASGSLAQADDATYSVFDNGGGFPHAKFVLAFMFATAPTEGTVLSLYAQPLDILGTSDAEVPEATRPTVVIGNFTVNNVTTQQVAELLAQDVPWKAAYYIHNNATGQTVSAGWSLGAIPYTLKAAA